MKSNCDTGISDMDGESKSRGVPRWAQTAILGRRPRWTLIRVAVLVITTFVLFEFVVIPIRVVGISMSPNYPNGSINLINRLAYANSKPQRGDVVGVRMAGEHLMFMKRIVGLPGESVSFEGGVLHINGEPIEEPYVKFQCRWEMAPVHLGANWYYVVGDNRSMRREDHSKGKVDLINQIVGKVMLKGKS